MKLPRKTRKGSILVTILLFLSILAILVAAVAKDSGQALQTVAQSSRDTQAKYAAYAGLESAMNELRIKETYHGDPGITKNYGELRKNLKGLDNFEYEVLIWNNIKDPASTDEPKEIDGPDGIKVQPDTVYLVSSGRNVERGEEVIISSMAGTARRVRPTFDDAAYAKSKLAVMGADSLVDAWDSVADGDYVAGDFPGSTGGGGGGGPGAPSPNVQDYKATIGTDTAAGRTLRLLDGAKLNGYYRVGPTVDNGNAFGLDSGTTSGGFTGSSTTEYAVTTAQSPNQIAGQEPSMPGTLGDDKYMVDNKDTEVPRFTAPFADEDCIAPPTLNNSRTPVLDGNGKQVYNDKGKPMSNPPAPVALAPGAYTHVEVPADQTLELTAGVYYFRDEMLVQNGKVTTKGDGPVVIFCGKKATFDGAKINPDGGTAKLQLCFTDGDKENSTNLDEAAAAVRDVVAAGGVSPDAVKAMISPQLSSNTSEREGFSFLDIKGESEVHGGISGNNLVANFQNSEIFGSVMGNIVKAQNAKIHQDLSLKGSNLMVGGEWILEGVHQIR